MKKLARRLISVLALSLSACGGSADDGPVTPPPPAADLADYAHGSNAFAFDLYGRIRAQPGNLAMSPLSITGALTLAWAGARGETAAQMQKVLHGGPAADRAMDVAGKFVGSYRSSDKKVTLRVANRLFGDKAYTFEQPYLDRARATFGAPLEAVDFRHDPAGSAEHINAWVAKQTKDRIKNVLPRDGLSADTRLVITNAVYFLGDWAHAFSKSSTTDQPFHVTAAQDKSVPMMSQTNHVRFAHLDGVSLVDLPYKGDELAMLLVVPDAVGGLDAVERKLTATTYESWTHAMGSHEVTVFLPRFEIDPAGSIPLSRELTALGMPLAFDPGHADFTGLANPPDPRDRLYIDQVFHKAFVKVDEKGTEAAAATAVAAAAPTAAAEPPPTIVRADRPFLFFIRDVASGTIVFMGRVSDPSVK